MALRSTLFLIFFLGLSFFARAEDEDHYWEYGAGFGYVHYEHYPASREFAHLFLPFPTFQYRGKIVRADDREGARAYLLRGARWNLEFSGTGHPGRDSAKTEAREGMDNLPWIFAFGPRLAYRWSPEVRLSLAVFQATATDWRRSHFSGQIYEGRAEYRWGDGSLFGRCFFTLTGGSREYMAVYFDVPRDQVKAGRSSFESEGGFLSQEFSIFQTYKKDKASFYAGGSFSDYSRSVNRSSPLHLSDGNLVYLVGVTYVLGESTRPAVPEEDTSGLINRLRGPF